MLNSCFVWRYVCSSDFRGLCQRPGDVHLYGEDLALNVLVKFIITKSIFDACWNFLSVS